MKRRSFLAAIASAIAAPAVRAVPMPTPNLVDWPGSLVFVKPPAAGLTPFSIWDSITLGPGLSITEQKGGRPWPFFGAPAPARFFLEQMSIDFPYWRQTEDLERAARDITQLLNNTNIRLASGDGPPIAEMPLAFFPTRWRLLDAGGPVGLPLWPTWGVDDGFKMELAPMQAFELERALTVRTTLHGYIDANLLAEQK